MNGFPITRVGAYPVMSVGALFGGRQERVDARRAHRDLRRAMRHNPELAQQVLAQQAAAAYGSAVPGAPNTISQQALQPVAPNFAPFAASIPGGSPMFAAPAAPPVLPPGNARWTFLGPEAEQDVAAATEVNFILQTEDPFWLFDIAIQAESALLAAVVSITLGSQVIRANVGIIPATIFDVKAVAQGKMSGYYMGTSQKMTLRIKNLDPANANIILPGIYGFSVR